MALEAPRHAEWFCFIDDRHFIDCAMTAVTADAAVHMDGVIEISIVRQLVNTNPWNWLACFPALLHGREARAVRFDFSLAVTIDASLCVWNIRMARNLNKTVAVAAVHAELLHMDGMRKGNRLVRLVTDAGVLRREVIPNSTHEPSTNHC